MKRYVLLLIISAVVIFGKPGLASAPSGYPLAADGYEKLEIYYYFGYESPILISLDRARKISQTKIISTDSEYISNFIRWLDVDAMRRTKKIDINATHAFIVIDFYRLDDGKVETFYSDGNYLYSVDPSMRRIVDKKFRRRFYFDVNNDSDIIEVPAQ